MSRILPILLIASLAVAVSSLTVTSIPPLILTMLNNLAQSIIAQALTVPLNISQCAAAKIAIILASFNDLVEDIVEDLPNEITLSNLPTWISQEIHEIQNATDFIDPTCFINVAEQEIIGTFEIMAQGYMATLTLILSVVGFLG